MKSSGDEPVRIAMWSGPRNISTAMMRSFGARADCAVIDEPFYGFYLDRTGYGHPMRDEILASMPCDWRGVAKALTGSVPGGKCIHYQKHMTQHLLDEIDWNWLDRVTNCFLIRDPAAVVVSFIKERGMPAVEELGFERQWRIFDHVRDRTGKTPPVLDSADILRDPERALSAFCDAVGIPFDPAMLSWPPGKRPEDGVWGAHWYKSVEASTGFRTGEQASVDVPEALRALERHGREFYDRLYPVRITG